jgi:hypothetical protein
VLAAVSDLRKSLERCDAAALESYSALADLLEGSFSTVPLERLGAAVNRFEFEAALTELEQIAGELDADLRELTLNR